MDIGAPVREIDVEPLHEPVPTAPPEELPGVEEEEEVEVPA